MQVSRGAKLEDIKKALERSLEVIQPYQATDYEEIKLL